MNRELRMMRVTTRTALLAALLLSLGSAQAEVYRWVDKDGKVQYSDNPPPDAKVEQRKMKDNSVDVSGPGYEATRVSKLAPLTLYVYADCKNPCELGRKFLTARKLPFKESVIATQEEK